ncbi:MAG: SPOR domain-containing protein, partial [Trueperaceae bacterium]
RNWPDLAIGIALVAVIAGIIATLLTGGSFFPLGPSTPAETPSPPAVATPAPDPEPTLPLEPVVPDEAAAPPAEEPPPIPQPGVEVLAPDGTPADTPPAAVAPDPAPPTDPEPAAPPAAVADPAPTPEQPVAVPDPEQPVAEPMPAAPAQPTAAPDASSDPEAPYRVSVGAFGSAENAERQAATFRAAGFPVFTGTQGNLTIVLVGPYESEADAVAVAMRIRGGDFGIDPVVYRFQPDATSAAGATPAPSDPAGPAAAPTPPAAPAPAATPAPAPTPAPTPAPAPAASGERYVQVGAFATAASAEPLRERLAGLGFATREVQEDGLVKLLVGPFDDAALAAARQRLDAQGIQNFPR